MPATIADVAKRAGVSKATVSNVLTGKKKASPDTIAKVTDACLAVNYHPNIIAQSLRTKTTGTIGLVLPLFWGDDYNIQIIQGIRRAISKEDLFLLVGSTENTQEDEIAHVEKMISHHVDGLIVIPSYAEIDYPTQVYKTGVPTVFMDRKVKGESADCVMSNNFLGAHDAVTALIAKGHRKIGLITSTLKVTTILDRTKGYRSALQDAGIPIDENCILFGESGRDRDGVQMMQTLLEAGDVTAVFVADCTFISAISYAQQSGVRFPQDLAVIIFDDLAAYAVMRPSLSAVRQPMLEMGEKAARLVLDRIANPGRPFETCYLSTTLMLRESV